MSTTRPKKKALDKRGYLCYNTQALKGALKYRGVEQLEARRAHNPEVVGSSPASATITDTVMDTNVSVTVSFFIPIFTPKRGETPNFATHLLQVLPSCCGFVICTECLIPTYCGFNLLNNRYSLNDCFYKIRTASFIPKSGGLEMF